ncbi:MAG: MFS transporter [Deltaproteobacteria bacterium]|nr:MFS transporter [Deltaproteobacteria bacterium]
MSTNNKKESPFLNLLLNIVIPSLVLMKLSGESMLGPLWSLILALAFPIAYGMIDLIRFKKFNLLSIIGLISILLTGGIGLLELNLTWMIIKEAGVPAIIGIAIFALGKTKHNLMKKIILNDQIMDVNKIQETLDQNNQHKMFQKILERSNLFLSLSFFISAFLNFLLATWIFKSPPGTEAFNQELGRMTALSFPVIALPSMVILIAILFFSFRALSKLTGLDWKDLFKAELQ